MLITGAFPDLSTEDQRRCYDPGVIVGADARAVIADHRVALADCRQRHQRVVNQYRDIQTGLTTHTEDQT